MSLTVPETVRSLAASLVGCTGRIVRREILCAAAGLKPVRLMPHVEDAPRLVAILRDHGLAVEEASESTWIGTDAGKGGWSSDSVPPGEGAEHRHLYVARDARLASDLREAETSGSSDEFGRLLLVPACCRDLFRRVASEASRVQNDFFGFSFPLPQQVVPWELNLVAQYFDAALVSHYPCRPDCPYSLRLARLALRIVRSSLPADADSMVDLMMRTGVYSEFDGICLLRPVPGPVGWIQHDPAALVGTSDGPLRSRLAVSPVFRPAGETIERPTDSPGSLPRVFRGLRVVRPVASPLPSGVGG